MRTQTLNVKAYDEVRLLIEPDAGFAIDRFEVLDSAGNTVKTHITSNPDGSTYCTFTCPAVPVTVNAWFKSVYFSVNVKSSSHGTISLDGNLKQTVAERAEPPAESSEQTECPEPTASEEISGQGDGAELSEPDNRDSQDEVIPPVTVRKDVYDKDLLKSLVLKHSSLPPEENAEEPYQMYTDDYEAFCRKYESLKSKHSLGKISDEKFKDVEGKYFVMSDALASGKLVLLDKKIKRRHFNGRYDGNTTN